MNDLLPWQSRSSAASVLRGITKARVFHSSGAAAAAVAAAACETTRAAATAMDADVALSRVFAVARRRVAEYAGINPIQWSGTSVGEEACAVPVGSHAAATALAVPYPIKGSPRSRHPARRTRYEVEGAGCNAARLAVSGVIASHREQARWVHKEAGAHGGGTRSGGRLPLPERMAMVRATQSERRARPHSASGARAALVARNARSQPRKGLCGRRGGPAHLHSVSCFITKPLFARFPRQIPSSRGPVRGRNLPPLSFKFAGR